MCYEKLAKAWEFTFYIALDISFYLLTTVGSERSYLEIVRLPLPELYILCLWVIIPLHKNITAVIAFWHI